MDSLEALASMWLAAKFEEGLAVARRRDLEDKMRSLIGIAETLEGTETAKPGKYVVKVTGRIDRKVDSERLQELAAEAGLTDHLSSLFRWKPELNLAVWRASAPAITNALAGAITAKPGRPSFQISIKED